MKDIFLFAVGEVAIIFMGWFEVNRFRKGEFNPSLFRFGKEDKRSIWEVISGVIAIMVTWFIKGAPFIKAYSLTLVLILGTIESVFYLLLYRDEKDKKHILRLAVNVGITIFFVVVFVKFIEW